MHNPFAKHINIYAARRLDSDRKTAEPVPQPKVEQKIAHVPHGGGGAVPLPVEKPKKLAPKYKPGEKLLKKIGGREPPPKKAEEEKPSSDLDDEDVRNIQGAICDIMIRLRRGG